MVTDHIRVKPRPDTGSAGYRLGVYGSRNTCARLLAAGVAESCFVADMSTGYGGNGFPMPEGWAFDQIQGVKIGAGAGEISIDRVVADLVAQLD